MGGRRGRAGTRRGAARKEGRGAQECGAQGWVWGTRAGAAGTGRAMGAAHEEKDGRLTGGGRWQAAEGDGRRTSGGEDGHCPRGAVCAGGPFWDKRM